MKAKYIITTIVMAFLLFVLGFWFLPTLLAQLTKNVVEIKLIAVTHDESANFVFANAFLLAACAPAAAVMLWAYSRKRSGWPRIYGFFLCLLITIASVAMGIGLRLLAISNGLRWSSELVDINAIAISYLRYSRWGFGALVVVCGAITIALLLLSQQRADVTENL